METRLVKLKSDFNNIINIRTNVKNVFDILQVRIDKLHQIYSEFIKNNKNDMFVFGLDSFHFQSKLIDIEYDDMKRLFLAINNRMYCEYFKLHKIIVEYISKNINDRKAIDLIKINNYPIYKDLEPFKDYKFELILDIHENILNLLGIIISLLNNKENELSIHRTKQNIGLNIDNFITTFNFNINVMKEKIVMFITYIEFFHRMHTKYLKRFSNKIQLIYTHINNDIKFDDTIEVSKNKKRELIDELVRNDIDSELLKDIKTSIGSETNSENSSEDSKSTLNSHLSLQFENLTNSLISPVKKYTDIHLSLSNVSSLEDNTKTVKKTYKDLFKKNVHKVTNMLQLCKPKEEKTHDPNVLNTDLDTIFSGINKSCDSIIDSNENIGLNIEFLDSKHDSREVISLSAEINDETIIKSTPQKSDANNSNKEIKVYEEELNIDEENQEIKIEEPNEIKVEEPDEIKAEEPGEIKVEEHDEINVEEHYEIKVEETEETKVEEHDEIKVQEPTKQKRKYNRKKKS